MDQLQIKDLEIFAYHGLFPSEKELGQKFIIDASLSYDITKSSIADRARHNGQKLPNLSP